MYCIFNTVIYFPPTYQIAIYIYWWLSPFYQQLLREGKPEERVQTRTGQLVSFNLLKVFQFYAWVPVIKRWKEQQTSSFPAVFLQTVEFLKGSKLKISKMPVDEFQVTKEVVCRQFLKKVWLSLSFLFPLHYIIQSKCWEMSRLTLSASAEHKNNCFVDLE